MIARPSNLEIRRWLTRVRRKPLLSRGTHQDRASIVSTAQLTTVLVIALLASCLILVMVVTKYREQQQRSESMRSSHIARQKEITRREVERIVESIRMRRDYSRSEAVGTARQRVYQAHMIAESIYQTYGSDRSQPQIVDMILAALRSVRFDQGHGYYFVYSLDGEMLLPGRSDIEGAHVATLESRREQSVSTNIIALAEQQGEGFVEYEWNMPGKKGSDHTKISYVKRFAPYDLVIGTGLYLEDIEAVAKQELKEEISNIRYGANGYFFINDFRGNVLAHGLQSELVGASNWDYTDSRGNKLFQDLRQAIENPDGGFCNYWWRMPETGEERPKIAFAMGVPEWEWLIGTGLYVDEVEADITDMQAQILHQSIREISLILLMTVAIIFMVLLFMRARFRGLRRDMLFFEDCFSRAAYQDVSIDESQINFIELLKIARNANSMLREKAQFQNRLHEEKQQLYATLQSITDAVIAIDQEQRIVLMNAVAEQMIDCSRDCAIGRRLPDVLHFSNEQENLPYHCPIAESLDETRTIAVPENVYLIGNGGRQYNIEIVVSPIGNAEGIPQGCIVILRDITEKLKSEEQRLQLKKLESVGVLAGGIAHDFNNLLTGLMGNIDLAKAYVKPDDPAYPYVSGAESAISSARNLALQLLTFAKGGDPIKCVISLQEDLVFFAKFTLRGSNIHLETEISDDLLPVAADKGQISQVISNLLINARQAMAQGGKVILKAENEDEEWIRITVRDHGPGIPADIQEKIFDPYFSTKSGGSGLGLSSCYSIVRKHGGSITVESAPGKGASFIIRLPASHEPLPPKTSALDEGQITASSNESARILVVDDMEIVRKMLTSALTNAGYEVETAQDGVEAKEKYEQAMKVRTPFDLVITDLTIPGGQGGEELARNLLAFDPNSRIIVSSGYSDSPIMSHYRDFGFVGCIVKPYHIIKLLQTIRDILADARLHLPPDREAGISSEQASTTQRTKGNLT